MVSKSLLDTDILSEVGKGINQTVPAMLRLTGRLMGS